MNKKLLIIAGQTGVGKTKLANEIARKINGEIILVDSIQLYKHMNIISNKPNRFLQESAKYHNLNEYDLKEGTVTAMTHAEKIRKTISEVWSRNKIPILEGGCGFYYKAILSGAQERMTEQEEELYSKYVLVAREIIKRDKNFQISFDRLRRMDTSIPECLAIKNDFYRLEKRLADAMLYGDGAFKKIQEIEKKIRAENKFSEDISIYNFFLYCDKLILNKKIQDRADIMLQSGILKEVSNLLSQNIITPQMFSKENGISSSVFIHAYGLVETVQFFIKLLDQVENKDNIIKSYGGNISKKDTVANKYKILAFKMLFGLLASITISSRQYAKRQATWFKKNENFLWLNGENTNLSELIINRYLPMTKEEFNSNLNSEENENVKLNYKWTNIKRSDPGYFKILNNNQSMKNLIVDSFKFCEDNKEKLLEIKGIFEKEKVFLDNNINQNIDEEKIENNKVDHSLVEKYLKL
jgi:tRNA dimethylallyltransferase